MKTTNLTLKEAQESHRRYKREHMSNYFYGHEFILIITVDDLTATDYMLEPKKQNDVVVIPGLTLQQALASKRGYRSASSDSFKNFSIVSDDYDRFTINDVNAEDYELEPPTPREFWVNEYELKESGQPSFGIVYDDLSDARWEKSTMSSSLVHIRTFKVREVVE
jgi:hypothetical protein